MKMAYVFSSRIGWGSALQNLHDDLLKCDSNLSISCFESSRLDEMNLYEYDLIVINHSINFYRIMLFSSGFLPNRDKIITIFHEGEPLVEKKHISAILVKTLSVKPFRLLSYLKWYYYLPKLLSKRVVGLSSIQVDKALVSESYSLLRPCYSFSGSLVARDASAVFFPFPQSDPIKFNLDVHNYFESRSFKITYALSFSQIEMKGYYRQSAVCVIPSIVESYCLAALEALFCGCDVIICKSAGVLDFLETSTPSQDADSQFFDFPWHNGYCYVSASKNPKARILSFISEEVRRFYESL